MAEIEAERFDLYLGLKKALGDDMDGRFRLVDQKFDLIERRFEQIDRRFEQIDQRLDLLDQRIDRVELAIDRLENRIRVLTGFMITVGLALTVMFVQLNMSIAALR